jgi:hypothetical protein
MELYCDGFAGSYDVHVVDFLLQYKQSSIFFHHREHRGHRENLIENEEGDAGSYDVHVVDFLFTIIRVQYFLTTENTEGTED